MYIYIYIYIYIVMSCILLEFTVRCVFAICYVCGSLRRDVSADRCEAAQSSSGPADADEGAKVCPHVCQPNHSVSQSVCQLDLHTNVCSIASFGVVCLLVCQITSHGTVACICISETSWSSHCVCRPTTPRWRPGRVASWTGT